MKDKTIFVIVILVLLVFSLYFLFVVLNPIDEIVPDSEDFMPLEVIFEDDIKNITLYRGSSTNVVLTLVSSLHIDITVKITPVFNTAVAGFNWFSAEIEPNPVNLGPFDTQVVDLTVSVAGDTPSDVVSDMLLLQLNSTQSKVFPWSPTRVVFVESS